MQTAIPYGMPPKRWVLTIPREIPPDQYAVLVREFCEQQFVSKGMIADFAIHAPSAGTQSPRPCPADDAGNGRTWEMASQEPQGL